MGDRFGADRLRSWVPRWWRGEAGVIGEALSVVLSPAELAYGAVVQLRSRGYTNGVFRVERAQIPVISVGNIAVGGAGKTPITAWIAGILASWGRRPAIVLRGYGADEVLVHRELNPNMAVIPAARRIDGAREAATVGCDVVVLDDGFQHRALYRDLDIVLIAAETWSAGRRLLPRGPWREDVGALDRADVLVVTRKSASLETGHEVAAALMRMVPGSAPVIAHLAADRLSHLHDVSSARSLDSLGGASILAVASLADPQPFAEQVGQFATDVELLAFADHHDFSADEAADMLIRADRRPIVMTRKEAVKLRPLLGPSTDAWVLEQRVEVEEGTAGLHDALRRAVGA